MSRTLPLVDQLLERGRQYQTNGRPQEAFEILGKLARRPNLSAEIAEEVRSRLAELALRHERPSRARRHLAAALAANPESPRFHHLMAEAIETDAKSDPKRALAYRRRSLKLEPDNPTYLCAHGLLALQEGQPEEGLRSLRRAAELAPNNPEILAQVVEGLRQMDAIDEARQLLRLARFQNPRDFRFQKLWDDFQYELLKSTQERARVARLYGEGPVMLSFARPKNRKWVAHAEGKILRRDGAEPTAAPHLGKVNRRKRAL